MIQRFTCNMEILDECPHIEPLLKDAEGGYVRFTDHAAELARVEGERDANRRLLNKALKENALLRAECEAWRKNDDQYDDADESNTLWKAAYKARAATDAAGALKGVTQ